MPYTITETKPRPLYQTRNNWTAESATNHTRAVRDALITSIVITGIAAFVAGSTENGIVRSFCRAAAIAGAGLAVVCAQRLYNLALTFKNSADD